MNHVQNKGMTLIELMISVAIMAVVASGAFKVYSNLQSAHERIDQKTDQLDRLQRFWQIFRQDASFAIDRKIRAPQDPFGPDGDRLFDTSDASIAGEASVVQWSRSGGLPNLMLKTPQSELRRLAYGFTDQKLYRFQWDQMDPAQDGEPQSMLLLDNVLQFDLRYGYVEPQATSLQANKTAVEGIEKKEWKWADQWPLQSNSLNSSESLASNDAQSSDSLKTTIPSLIELTLQVEGLEPMTRLFEFGAPDAGIWQSLKESPAQQDENTNSSDNSDNSDNSNDNP